MMWRSTDYSTENDTKITFRTAGGDISAYMHVYTHACSGARTLLK